MQNVTIKITGARGGYNARVDQDDLGVAGESCDEALGYALRYLWLAGVLNQPIQLNLVLPGN